MDPECPDCLGRTGLCRSCQRAVLPQLAQPFWYKQAHSGLWTDAKERAHTENAAAIARAERRNVRKRHRAGLVGLIMHVATAA